MSQVSDCMTEVLWNYETTIAWIVSRDRKLTQAIWESSIEPKETGLETPVCLLLIEELCTEMGIPKVLEDGGPPIAAAKRCFLRAARNGKIRIKGVNLDGAGGLEKIPQDHFWVDSDIFFEGAETILSGTYGDRRTLWKNLRTERVRVLQEWPAVAVPSSGRAPNQTAREVSRCLDWMKRQVEASPDRQPHNKDWYRVEALSKFSVSRRSFDNTIWPGAIVSSSNWGRPGPKSSRSNT